MTFISTTCTSLGGQYSAYPSIVYVVPFHRVQNCEAAGLCCVVLYRIRVQLRRGKERRFSCHIVEHSRLVWWSLSYDVMLATDG